MIDIFGAPCYTRLFSIVMGFERKRTKLSLAGRSTTLIEL